MRIYIVAAFADAPFTGNPAGVCLLRESVPDPTMQAIARELNQPETIFVIGSGSTRDVRWFSPEVEMELCGHATLAAAHVLWSEGAAHSVLRFRSPRHRLVATLDVKELIWLDFPALPGFADEPPQDVLASIGNAPKAAARDADRWLFEYEHADEVRAIRPDFEALRRTGIRSLIVTAPSDDPAYDIVSRNFAPIVGVNEDQVTGMAHTCLAPHWLSRFGPEMRCWQASARGGAMMTRHKGARVELGGRAVIEIKGRWRMACVAVDA